MNKRVSMKKFNSLLETLSSKYKIMAPKVFEKEGRYSYDDDVRYGEVKSFEEIVFEKKSTASPKEVLLPIVHTLSVQVGESVVETVEDKDERDILVFVHPCDIHGITRIDNTFKDDAFYQNRRKKIKFVMIECISGGWDSCFCVSLNTNKTDNYSLAMKVENGEILLSCKDETFNEYLEELENIEKFEFKFVEKNKIEIKMPNLEPWDRMTLEKIKESKIWDEFSDRCIGCGSCNMACMTCTCMNTIVVTSELSENIKEKRRVWSGCQLVRSKSLEKAPLSKIVPKRIRQRILDKFYRPKLKESREQICVGCGRCTDACPKYINFAATINKFNNELDRIYAEFGREEVK